MFGAAGVASSFAQGNVYSVNVVGYINLTLNPGYNMLANQLDNGNGNILQDILPNPPGNLTVWKFTGAGYQQASYVALGGGTGLWIGGDAMSLAPGEGAFFQNTDAAAYNITFVGEVRQGDNMAIDIPVGYKIVSSIPPQAGALQTDLNFQPSLLDTIWMWTGNGYDQFSYVGVWVPGEPTVDVGEAFWSQSTDHKTWTRTFHVN